MGLPCICQDDIETYEDAIYKFNTVDELHDQIKSITKDGNSYMKACRKSYDKSKNFWLDDNMDYWTELFNYPYGDNRRKTLNSFNNI